jgi:PAS domain S-box-containing protein
MTTTADLLAELAGARERAAELEEQNARLLAKQREAERRYGRLVEELPLAVYIDRPFALAGAEYVSPPIEDLLGYPRQAWLEDGFFESILHPDDRDRVLADHETAFERGDERWSFEYRILAEDGRTVWVRDDAVVVRDDEGAPQYVQGFLIDITEQKQAHAELTTVLEAQSEAERRYRQLIEELPLAVYTDRPDETSTSEYISPRVEAIFGYPPEAWMEEDFFGSILHPDDRERVLSESATELSRGDDRWSSEYRVIAADGRTVWVRDDAWIVKDEHGTPTHVQGFMIDVTEQALAEAEIRRQKQYFESLVEVSPVAVVIMDREKRVTGWNPAATQLFGYASEEALGRQIDDLVCQTEELREEGRGVGREAMESGSAHRITRRTRKDGALVDVGMVVVPLAVDKEHVGFYAIYHDIGELQRAREAAEAATKAKGAFLATMSHEIRTPMNAVIGMTGLLIDTELTLEQRELADVVRSSGDALLRIIDDTLDYSKIEAGKLELEAQPFDLRACVETALDIVAARASDKRIELAGLVDERVPAGIVGDPTRLRQVLLNLLSNAVKFTEEGEVVLTASAEPDGSRSWRLHLAVRDTGIGIPSERMGRLFESFSQVDASTTRRYGGTGLGLAISNRLVELMGGELRVESEEGKGSTFHVELTAQEAEVAARADVEDARRRLEGMRALVVDDNTTNLEIVSRQLGSWGMLAEAVEQPSEALSRIRGGERFDVAVLDMLMPEMDGVTLAREIRRHRDEEQLPLLLLTSLGHIRESRSATEFAAQLTKPVKASQLYEALLKVLAIDATPDGAPAVDGDGSRPDAPALRLLVAEDNAVNQRLALALLGKLGYGADLVENGLEAVEALEREPYDVVLMDVQMPELDGLEATRRIRARFEPGEGPTIIAMTANAMEGDRDECLAAGMDDYLSKPIRVDELDRALARCRPRSEAVDTAALSSLAVSFGGGEDGWNEVRALVDTFLEDAPTQVAALHGAVEEGDAETARRAAHTLKSNGATFGAEPFAELCRELEGVCRQGTLDAAPDLLSRVDAEWERVLQGLEAVRAGGAPAQGPR